jgi:hypothetical protein
VTQQGFEVICKKLVEHEKENADLKRDKEDLIFIRNQNAKCMCEDKERFTKAKKIIKELMSFSVQLCDCRHTVDFEKTREEAVQFLGEVEK